MSGFQQKTAGIRKDKKQNKAKQNPTCWQETKHLTEQNSDITQVLKLSDIEFRTIDK